jgi:hypothetical protein
LDRRGAADDAVGADTGELMNPRQAADDRVILHVDVAREVRRIGHDDVVP